MVSESHAILLACRVLAVSESGYYAQHARPPSPRAIRHALLTERIGRIHLESRGTYGARRVHAELTLGQGLVVGRCAVELLMRRAGIAGVSGRPRFRRIPHVATAADLVERRFRSEDPDELWVTDITEHPTHEGKVYCAVVLDVFSRRVVGWSPRNPVRFNTAEVHAFAVAQATLLLVRVVERLDLPEPDDLDDIFQTLRD
jgi:transposase InsO family protein